MEIIKSTHRDDVVFIGHNEFDGIDNDAMTQAIEQSTGLEQGRDFDGIEREDMEAPHTYNNEDLESFGQLFDSYHFVEYVTLRPVH